MKRVDIEGAGSASAGGGKPSILSINAAIFKDVKVQVEARLGRTTLTIEELLGLKPESILKLDLRMNETIELLLNEAVVARGEIVAVDDSFGVRLTEVAQFK